MQKKLIALLAMLLILLGNLFSTEMDANKKKGQEEKLRIVIRDKHDFHLDLKELRAALKELESFTLPDFDIRVDLTELNRELAEIPRVLVNVKKELAALDGLDIRIDLKGIDKSLRSMEKELKRIDIPDMEVIVGNALKSLEGLDERIEAAIDAAFDSMDEE